MCKRHTKYHHLHISEEGKKLGEGGTQCFLLPKQLLRQTGQKQQTNLTAYVTRPLVSSQRIAWHTGADKGSGDIEAILATNLDPIFQTFVYI